MCQSVATFSFYWKAAAAAPHSMESRYCQKPINLKVLVETDFSIIEFQNYMFSLETIWLTFGKLWSSCLRKASVLASEFSDSRLRVSDSR